MCRSIYSYRSRCNTTQGEKQPPKRKTEHIKAPSRCHVEVLPHTQSSSTPPQCRKKELCTPTGEQGREGLCSCTFSPAFPSPPKKMPDHIQRTTVAQLLNSIHHECSRRSQNKIRPGKKVPPKAHCGVFKPWPSCCQTLSRGCKRTSEKKRNSPSAKLSFPREMEGNQNKRKQTQRVATTPKQNKTKAPKIREVTHAASQIRHGRTGG